MYTYSHQHVVGKVLLTVSVIVATFFCGYSYIFAEQIVNLNANDLIANTQIFFSPQSATFQEDSTFEVSVFLNTEGHDVNAVELHITFDPNKLSVISPSQGKSIIGLWVEPPSYDNSKGTVKIIGAIPTGIKSDSGLLTNIRFKAKAPGQAIITITDTSQVLLNDGVGTKTRLNTSRGLYTIVPKASAGPSIFSDTHPLKDEWYNNNSPIFTWDQDPQVTGFSIVFDNKPTTIPDNTINTTEAIKAYQNVADGVWYLHVKPIKNGVWGNTSHYAVHIDTTPPALFTPRIDYLSASAIARFLVSFFTTDALSGVSHYEVGVIDKSTPVTESPAFVETESPYQLPFDATQHARIIVRAFDKAGNIREASVNASAPFLPFKLITDNAVSLLFITLVLIIIFFIAHYVFNHRIFRRIEKGFELLQKEESKEQEALRVPPPTVIRVAEVKAPAPSQEPPLV